MLLLLLDAGLDRYGSEMDGVCDAEIRSGVRVRGDRGVDLWR